MTKEHVKERVDDWESRIHDLYAKISQWLIGTKYSLKIGPKSWMREDVMVNFKIPRRSLPTADIYDNGRIVLTIKPRGLWMIGVNGRIDLISDKGSSIVVDKAEQFRPPQWIMYSSENRYKGSRLTKEEFLNILKEPAHEYLRRAR